MKRVALISAALLGTIFLFGQNIMKLHTGNEIIQMEVSETDSLFFTENGTIANFRVAGNLSQFNVSEIDSITFDLEPVVDSTVYVYYTGTSASVNNPLESVGVTAEVDGANVTITSTAPIAHINYVLSGSSNEGSFRIYSDERIDLILDGVNITNPDGPAINIQSDKRVTVELVEETNNSLTDGENYLDPPNGEDQDAAFFSEGQLVFEGSGNLTIIGLGLDQHGLASDDYIRILGGNITVSSAVKDGIHAKDGFFMEDGNVEVTSDGDGVDAGNDNIEISGGVLTVHSQSDEVSAVKCDSTLIMTDGLLDIEVSGDKSKGLNSNMEIILYGGIVDINTSGGVILEASGQGYDPSYCSAIKSETLVMINGASVTINSTGEAGRGISSDGDIVISGGSLEITASGDGDTYTNIEGDNDAYHGACLNADGNISIIDGNVTLSHSGDGGKGITTDTDLLIGGSGNEPIIEITTTGERITISSGGWPPGSGDYDEAKAVKADGNITIESGEITIDSADDGLKTLDTITINDGTINIIQSEEAIEGPNIIINGGNISLVSHDDGLNATYGNGGEQNDGSLLEINGGYIYINSSNGDPLDSNGNIHINGGVIVVHGPQSSPEVGMDVNGSCIVTGGFLVVSGTNSNMTENASPSSTQYCVLLRTNQQVSANTIFHIEDNAGNSLLTFKPVRSYYSIIFSSDQLSSGTTYKVYTGGSCTGTPVNGLYEGGTYSGGTLKTTFSLSNMAPTVWF